MDKTKEIRELVTKQANELHSSKLQAIDFLMREFIAYKNISFYEAHKDGVLVDYPYKDESVFKYKNQDIFKVWIEKNENMIQVKWEEFFTKDN